MSSNPFALSNIQPAQDTDPAAENPFSLKSIQRAQGVDLREKLTEATAWNPDSAAEAARLAKRYPAPTDTVYRNLDQVKQRAAVDDAQAALARTPELAAKLRENPDMARQAHDDVDVLSEMAQAIRNIGSAALSGLQRGSEGVLGAVQAPFDIAAGAVDPLVGTVLPANPLRATAQGLSAWRQRIKAMAEGNMPKGEGNLEQGFYSGVSSLSTNLAALPLALMNPTAGLTAMVAPVGGQAYGQARDQNVAPLMAAQFGLSQAAIEYATEKIPVQRLIGDVRAGASIVSTLLRQMALEVPGEQVATALQDLNEWALLPENAEKTFADYLAARPDAAIQTLVATVVGTGGNVAVVKGIDAAMRRLESQDKGQIDGEALKKALQLAGQSKLMERNPEAFREALDAMTGDAEVRFDARTLLEQSGPEALVQAMPSLAEQLAEAQASGGEVRVPVSEFIAGVVGTPLEQSLREHARLGENEFSQAEAKKAAQQAEQFLQQEAERVIQQAQDQAAMRQSQEVVKQGVLDQLNKVGRFSPQVSEAYATFTSAFYTTMAGRLGITPEDMAARYPLRIVGQTPGSEGVMDQGRLPASPVLNTPRVPTADEMVRLSKRETVSVRQLHSTQAERRTGEFDPSVPANDLVPGFGDAPVVVRLRGGQMLVLDGHHRSEAALRNGDETIDAYVIDAAAYDPENAGRRPATVGIDYDANDLDALARELLDTSILKQAGQTQTDTPEFRAWFGNSKVVDAAGKPMVVYHGSPDARFADPAQGDGVMMTKREKALGKDDDRAFYFTSSPGVAKTYADPRRAWDYQNAEEGVIATYVSLQNPLVYDAEGKHWREAQSGISKENFIAEAKAAGHDGVIIRNVRDSYDSMKTGRDPVSDVVVAFSSNQVKSATGNSGAFDPNDPSILKQGPLGTFSPSTLTLALNPNANLSTFLHESGHFFLEVMSDLAAQPNAPAGIVEDMNTLLAWFGVPDVATWRAMPLNEQRPYHERFAESIEQYLMEGKAPSLELQPVFQRFRSWLLRVYKSVKDFLAGRGVATGEGDALNQPAYHGTPYRGIEKFSTDKIGTGEGAQAYGWGLYFASKKEVAEHYRRSLSRGVPVVKLNGRTVKGTVFNSIAERLNYAVPHKITANDVEDELQISIDIAATSSDPLQKARGKEAAAALKRLKAAKSFEVVQSDNPGQLYEVEVPEDDTLLLWDKPLSEQPAAVRAALERKAEDFFIQQADAAGMDLDAYERMLVDTRAKYPPQTRNGISGEAYYRELVDYFGDQRAASDYLAAAGVKGIKYLDGTSRGAGDGSFNYVIFSGDDVAITNQFYQGGNTPGANIQLSDEVRRVFDRMLASEEQIRQAEEVAGMLPDETATNEALDKLTARSLRDMKWLANARSKAIKALQKQAKALRAEVQTEVTAEVDAMPEFRADAELKRIRKATKAKPTDADLAVVADSFGFPDADTMLKAIDAVGKRADVIEGLTDQRMLERHGDLIDQRAIEEAANAAVHNDARARALATELKAQAELLGKREDTGQTNAAGNPITVNALQRAAQLFAENVVARTPLKSLKRAAWDHTAAERRAAKAWQEATAAGKTQEAVQAKQDQVLNNAAAKAALEAQQEVVKIRDFFARIVKGNDEKTVERGRDPDVVNAARAILAAYGVQSPASKSALAYLDTVKTNDPAMFAAIEPAVVAALSNPRPLDTLTISELRALRDELDSLWHLAKRSRQMEVDGNLLDLDDAVTELQTRLQGAPPVIPGELSAMTPAEQAGRMLQFAVAITRRVESWAEALDGKYGGPFTRLIFGPVKAAADKYRSDRIEYRKKYVALLDNVAPTMRRGLIAAPELGYTFGKGHNGVGMAELLHAILHTGNASNKRKLLLGRGWATENADGTLDTARWDAFLKRMTDTGVIEKAHYDFAQGVWDLLEGTKALAQKAHRDVFGRYFAEVTAEAFDTPFGQYRGGYVPAQADTRIVTDAALRDLANQENENMAFAFPTTNKGFTKARVEYNRPLVLDLRTIAQHLDKVLLFSHMEPAVRDVRKALMAKGVSQPLSRIQPAAYEGMLTPWLNRSAKQIVETPILGDGRISRIASAVRARAGMALMFGNVSNTLQQITGLSSALVKVSAGSMRSATAAYIAHPKKTVERVTTASTYMRERVQNEVSAMNDAMNEILLDPSLYQRAQAWTQKHAYFLQSAFDNVISPIVWTGAYNDAIKKGMTNDEAVKFADSTVRQTQGSTMPEDVSRIETGTAFVRLFSQFIGYFNMVANTNATALMNIANEVGLKKGAGRAMGVVFAGLLMPIWVAEFIAQAMRGGPDDEDKDGWWIDDWLAAVFGFGTIKGMMGMIPGAGQAGQLIVNRFNDQPADDRMSLSPAVSIIESAAGAPASVYKAIADDASKQKAVRDVASLVSVATGLPALAVARPVGYLAGVADDRIDPTSPADAARGLVSGVASPESKQR